MATRLAAAEARIAALDAERAGLARELAAREHTYQNLYHHAPVMLHSIDPQGRLVSVSQYWLDTLGYAIDEVLGRRSTEFLTADSRRYALEEVLPAFYETGAFRDVSYQFVKKDGTVIDTLMSAIAERDAEGRITRSLAVIIDVTARNQAEAEARDLLVREQQALAEAQAARALEAMRRQLMAAVTHELRTPLTSILGYAELLDELLGEQASESEAACLEQVQRGVRRLALIVDDMLDMVGLETGTFALQERETDVGQLVAEVVSSLRPQAHDADLKLVYTPPGAGRVRWADPNRLGQVVLNLVGNAIKFTPKGGTITVRVEDGEGGLRCEVEDSGPGIHEADMPRLFQRYSQLEAGKRQARGTGLGLFIARSIVEAHGGTIGVRAQPGRGATFWFELPDRQAPPAGA